MDELSVPRFGVPKSVGVSGCEDAAFCCLIRHGDRPGSVQRGTWSFGRPPMHECTPF